MDWYALASDNLILLFLKIIPPSTNDQNFKLVTKQYKLNFLPEVCNGGLYFFFFFNSPSSIWIVRRASSANFPSHQSLGSSPSCSSEGILSLNFTAFAQLRHTTISIYPVGLRKLSTGLQFLSRISEWPAGVIKAIYKRCFPPWDTGE